MTNERRDWESPLEGPCESCKYGDHECSVEALGYACDCEPCEAARVSTQEFFNGLEDFFKSIDPDRGCGWDVPACACGHPEHSSYRCGFHGDDGVPCDCAAVLADAGDLVD